MDADIKQITEDLFLITLPPPMPGFSDFISVWLYRREEPVLIDVGPAATVPSLLAALDRLDVRDPAWILLTHIHIDHAGGIGEMAARFPETPVVCHPKAVAHLEDPTRLWRGSLQTLGDRALAYGEIRPVTPGQIASFAALEGSGIRPIPTPGHAAHHVSFHVGDYLCIGETGGVCLPFPEGCDYLRPATPPPFFLETALASIDRLLAEETAACCYGHYGFRKNGRQLLALHRDQLLRWDRLVGEEIERERDESRLVNRCMPRLFEEDPLLKRYGELAPDVQGRELGFMHNSIRGMIGRRTQAHPACAGGGTKSATSDRQ